MTDWRTDLAAFRERHPQPAGGGEPGRVHASSERPVGAHDAERAPTAPAGAGERAPFKHERAQESATGSASSAGGDAVRIGVPAGSPSSCEGAAPSGAASVSDQDPDAARKDVRIERTENPTGVRASALESSSVESSELPRLGAGVFPAALEGAGSKEQEVKRGVGTRLSAAQPSVESRPSGSPSSIAARAREIERECCAVVGAERALDMASDCRRIGMIPYAHGLAIAARLLADEEMRRDEQWRIDKNAGRPYRCPHCGGGLARVESRLPTSYEDEGSATPPAAPPKVGRGSLAGCNITCDACAAGIPFVDETQAEHVAADGFCEQPTPCAHTEFVALMGQTEIIMHTPPGSAAGGNTEAGGTTGRSEGSAKELPRDPRVEAGRLPRKQEGHPESKARATALGAVGDLPLGQAAEPASSALAEVMALHDVAAAAWAGTDLTAALTARSAFEARVGEMVRERDEAQRQLAGVWTALEVHGYLPRDSVIGSTALQVREMAHDLETAKREAESTCATLRAELEQYRTWADLRTTERDQALKAAEVARAELAERTRELDEARACAEYDCKAFRAEIAARTKEWLDRCAQVESLQHRLDKIKVAFGDGCTDGEIVERIQAMQVERARMRHECATRSDQIDAAEDALPDGYRVDAEHSLHECIQRLAADLRRARDLNQAWINDWESICRAAEEPVDTMATSLRGRIENMRARLDLLAGEKAAWGDIQREIKEALAWNGLALHVRDDGKWVIRSIGVTPGANDLIEARETIAKKESACSEYLEQFNIAYGRATAAERERDSLRAQLAAAVPRHEIETAKFIRDAEDLRP